MKCAETKLIELMQGALSPAEIHVVLRHLKTCRPCRERVKVMAILEKISPEREALRSRVRLLWIAAGLLIVALIPSIVLLNSEFGVQSDRWVQIAETKPYPYFPLDPRSGSEWNTERRKAFLAYNRGDYASALSIFNRIESDAEVLFYRGVCEYMLGHDEASLEHLRQSIHLAARWKAPSLWYQANLELRAGNVERARALLEQLSWPGSEYLAEAESLRRKLEPRIYEDRLP